jgi:primosomal protein N' (replication factor Y) (superfamily II helicase)
MKNDIRYINVALPVKVHSTFLYSIPEEMDIKDVIFKRVLVNFNNRIIRGFAVSEGEFTNAYKIKPIIRVFDRRIVLKPQMIEFANWIADYYFAGIGEALSLMVPKGLKAKEDDESDIPYEKKINNTLTSIQSDVLKNIFSDMIAGVKKFYLYGVTGSGKTEIYIKLIEHTLAQGKTVIFLVPEIALSYQTLSRLKESFGKECAVLHSGLKGSERLKEYFKLFDGNAKIAIGPRSALFAPLDNLGLIIIDEENDGAYKSEENPRFHTRSAGFYLANKNNCVLLLGSATPSVESWYFAKNGLLKLYSLNERYGGALLPDIKIIDKTEFTGKNLSIQLTTEINNRLKNKEQVVLLQNRRGFSNYIKCKSCKEIINCPKCKVSLTYHKTKNKLVCHHCGFQTALSETCPSCGNKELLKIGAGTERIEEEIGKTFPGAKIKRMDYDSLKSEKYFKELLMEIENGGIDILIGTQIIAKGLHFPKIKFVGIIDADIILNIPDFKASERTFSLITQVAGRAGRVGSRGLVFIQTANTENYAITAAKESDFELFYEKEILFRKELGMPPFVRLIQCVVRGKVEEKVIKDIGNLSNAIEKNNSEKISILGPAPCMLTKINNNFRYQILLKSRKIEKIQSLLKKALKEFALSSNNYLEIDVDPTSLF